MILFIANTLVPDTGPANSDRRPRDSREEIGVNFGIRQSAAQQIVALLRHAPENVQHSQTAARPEKV